MALCGFNQKMLDGLRLFGEGLYDQAEIRTGLDSVSMQNVFDNEIDEMEHFLKVLKALSEKDPDKYQSIIAITSLAQSLYKNAQGLNEPKQIYLTTLDKIIGCCVGMDEEYYERLLPHAKNPHDALDDLGRWTETHWLK